MLNYRTRQVAALFPGAYFLLSRVKGPRDLVYLVATSFIPAWWMLVRLADQEPIEAALNFALGYIAFIAIYEIGYVANDLFDASRTGGRRRWSGTAGPVFLLLFLLIRLAVWATIGLMTGWIDNPNWLIGTGVLVVVFGMHNLIEASSPRSATFVQLAMLRFTMPIIGILDARDVPLALLLALLLYVYLRWLAYLDSKNLLNIEERREPQFALVQMALLGPIVGLLAIVIRSSLPLEIWGFLLLLYVARTVLERRGTKLN